MKKLLAAFLMIPALAFGFDYLTFSEAFVNTAPDSDHKDFSWNFNGYSDTKLSTSFLYTFDSVSFRLSWPKDGDVFLDVTDGTVTTTNYVATIARTNLPPNGSYFAEFVGTSSGLNRIIAAGRVNIQHSIYENTGQSSWTNPLAGTVIGPPIHTLSTPYTLWPFATDFLELDDTPSAYTGQGGKLVSVNTGGTALEFTTAGSGSGDITAVNITAGTGMETTVLTASGDHDQTIQLNAASIASLALADSALQTESDTLADVTARGNATADHLDMGDLWHLTNLTSLIWSGGETISVEGSLEDATGAESLDWAERVLRLSWTITTDATSGQQAVGWSVLTNQIALLAPGGGTTYTAGTNLTLSGTEFSLDGAGVASLGLADTALQSEVQDIAAVVALDGDIGTGNITSAAGGTTLDMSSGKFYSSGGTVDISGGTGPALSGSAFSASIDATTGNQIVGWSVLTNQIALLAPAGGGGDPVDGRDVTNNIDMVTHQMTWLNGGVTNSFYGTSSNFTFTVGSDTLYLTPNP
jgi:hypothetical protein